MAQSSKNAVLHLCQASYLLTNLSKIILPLQLSKPPYQIRVQPSALHWANPEAREDVTTHRNRSCLFT